MQSANNKGQNSKKLCYRLAKKTSSEDFGRKIETDSKTNQKLFYRTFKILRKTKTHEKIKAKDRSIITEGEKVTETWREYFKNVLSSDINENENHRPTEEITQHMLPELEEQSCVKKEVTKTLKQLKRGKSAAHDRLTPEMLPNLGDAVSQC